MIRFNKEIQGTRDSDHYATPKSFIKNYIVNLHLTMSFKKY